MVDARITLQEWESATGIFDLPEHFMHSVYIDNIITDLDNTHSKVLFTAGGFKIVFETGLDYFLVYHNGSSEKCYSRYYAIEVIEHLIKLHQPILVSKEEHRVLGHLFSLAE